MEEIKQFCPNCKNEVNRSGRYKSYLCDNCKEIITDLGQNPIVFYNTELMGQGCQGYLKGKNETEKTKHIGTSCYIQQIEYFAKEAYFGGIVIQPIQFKHIMND